jgi:hypothetical protein
MAISNVAEFLEKADRLAGRLVANTEFPQFYGKTKGDLVGVAQEMLFAEYQRAGGLSGGSGMIPSFTGVYPLAGMSYGTSGLGLPSGMIGVGGMGVTQSPTGVYPLAGMPYGTSGLGLPSGMTGAGPGMGNPVAMGNQLSIGNGSRFVGGSGGSGGWDATAGYTSAGTDMRSSGLGLPVGLAQLEGGVNQGVS